MLDEEDFNQDEALSQRISNEDLGQEGGVG